MRGTATDDHVLLFSLLLMMIGRRVVALRWTVRQTRADTSIVNATQSSRRSLAHFADAPSTSGTRP
eukprot:1754350-Rhodomonas_salina.6